MIVLMTEPVGWMFPYTCAELESMLDAIGQVWGKTCTDVELVLMRDWELAAINLEHRGCHGPTNILSFPFGEADGGEISGSMFLSVDAFQRECQLYAQKPASYCVQLISHGMAHLAGWDHGAEMDSLTEQALQRLEQDTF